MRVLIPSFFTRGQARGAVNALPWILAAFFITAGIASAQSLTTLVSFNGRGNGGGPTASLIADANGNLFGTTETGGYWDVGTVFQVTKAAGAYASTPTVLFTFDYYVGAG